MGLDVYVGPLCRYYAGDWETVIQQMARAEGMDVQTVYQNGEPEKIDPEIVVKGVRGWQAYLGQQTGLDVGWNESLDGPYFTDKPEWDGAIALMYTGAYVLSPGAEIPKIIPDEFDKDPVFVKVHNDEALAGRIVNLLSCQLWLPLKEKVIMSAPTPGSDEPQDIGTIAGLLEELRCLNEATFKADQDQLDSWRRDGPPEDNSTMGWFKFGLAVFLEMASLAEKHRLPMMLDY
jgi:hypothetical protein